MAYKPTTPAKKTSLPPGLLVEAIARDGISYFEVYVKDDTGPTPEDYHCFLDTTLSFVLYDPPIDVGSADSNYSMVWVLDDTPVLPTKQLPKASTLGPYKISNYVTHNANTGDPFGLAYMNLGQYIMSSQGSDIFQIEVVGNIAEFYFEFDEPTKRYAIYTHPGNPPSSDKVYLLPMHDPSQPGARGKLINGFMNNVSNPFVFMIRDITSLVPALKHKHQL